MKYALASPYQILNESQNELTVKHSSLTLTFNVQHLWYFQDENLYLCYSPQHIFHASRFPYLYLKNVSSKFEIFACLLLYKLGLVSCSFSEINLLVPEAGIFLSGYLIIMLSK